MIYILSLIYFMLPAYMANLAPVLFKRSFLFLARPVDLGIKWRGQPLFGQTKTIRGFVVGIMSAIIIVWIQKHLLGFPFFDRISLADYGRINFIWLGFLFGFGALFGDLSESFIKRRLGMKSSQSWKIWDQLDYVVGSLLFVYWFANISIYEILTIFVISFILTVITNQIGYYLKIRPVRW